MKNQVLRVLVGCEFSGVVRRAFRARGHDAWSCDLLPSEDNSPYHIQGDVLEVIARGGWNLGIFFPPCTFILNSGCKWLYQDGKRFVRNKRGKVVRENPRDPVRWAQMEEGAKFFKACWNAPIERVSCENPIMVQYAKDIIGVDYTQLIQPYEFGHPESKATCLWLRNLPPLKPTKDVYAEMMQLPRKERERVHYASPGANRSQDRSRSYEGVGAAMAEQWSNL